MKFKHGKNLKIINKRSVIIGDGVVLGDDVTIEQGCEIKGNTTIGNGCTIKGGSLIEDCTILDGVTIDRSHLVGAEIGENCNIGPFARIRPKTWLGQGVKIGNFVEVKNSRLEKGVKVSHLAYVGDAEVGENTNVGCGVVFANYDGKTKNKTVVGKNCFIGSNSTLIAPLNIGDGVLVGAGSVVTKDVKESSLVIARSIQTEKEGWAKKYLMEDR